jgi:hypothetical protein
MQDAVSAANLEDQIRARWGQYGDWKAAGQDQVAALASLLRSNGVTDLGQLNIKARDYSRNLEGGMATTTGDASQDYYEEGSTQSGRTYDLLYGDKQLGFLGDINSDGSVKPYQAQKWDALTRNEDGSYTDAAGNWHADALRSNDSVKHLLGWSSAGHGNTSFGIFDGPNGEPIIAPVWGSSSQQTYNDLRGIASVLALAAGGAYAGAGGTTGAVAQGALQGYGTATAGNLLANPDGDVNSLVKSSLAGAATGAVSGGIKAFGADQGWSTATTKAVQGGANAAIKGGDGGDILKGAVMAGANSFLPGGATSATNGQFADLGGAKTMDFNFDPNWDYSSGGGNFDFTGWNVDGANGGNFDFSNITLDGGNGQFDFSNTSLADYLSPDGKSLDLSKMTAKNWVDLAKIAGTAGTAIATSGNSSNGQDRSNAVSDLQLQGMQFALDQSKELADYNKTTFRPIEQRLAQTAQEYDTEGRRESAAQAATGEVATEFDRTRQQAAKEMTRYGVDPSTMQALGTASLLDEAKARAGAANKARSDVEAQGWSRMADVANLGRNIASSQATQQQIGLSAGNSAADNAYKSAKLQQDEDKMLIEGVGQIGNYVGNLFATSDKTKKAGTGKMANAAKALKEVERTPVHEGWSYKDDPAKKKHTGPMAQDVKRVSGDKAAPGGKVIDMVSQQGRMMAAVQELSRRVKKLEAA